MNRRVKDEILKNLDAHLAADGFERPKRSQEWRKVVAAGEAFKLHLNFGLVLINPSVWHYSDRLAVLWRESGLHSPDSSPETAQFGQMLSVLSGHGYDSEQAGVSDDIYSDLVRLGFPYLECLRDCREVVRLLQSTNARDWPTVGRDSRAYSLLIALAESGQTQQALSLALSLEAELQSISSVRPLFTDFKRWFTSKYEPNPP
jgi:hypothetical protein